MKLTAGILRVILHLAFLVLAGVNGFWEVFFIGTRAVGDNPLGHGVALFLGTYFGLVLVERAVTAALSKRSWLPLAVSFTVSVVAGIAGWSGSLFVLLFLGACGFNWVVFAILSFVFLSLEALADWALSSVLVQVTQRAQG